MTYHREHLGCIRAAPATELEALRTAFAELLSSHDKLTRAIAAPAPVAQALSDEQIDRSVAAERDALLDHIYEHGTAAEGVIERVRKLARAAIEVTGHAASSPR